MNSSECTKDFDEFVIEVDLTEKSNQLYFDHIIDGRALFPGTGYLFVVWQQFAKHLSTTWDQLPIVFEDVKLLKKTVIENCSNVTFTLILSRECGHFQLFNCGFVVSTGFIREPKSDPRFLLLHQQYEAKLKSIDDFGSNREDIYSELWIRGYQYKDRFKPVICVDLDKGVAKMQSESWITLADAMLQCFILTIDTKDMLLPTSFEAIHCDPRTVTNILKDRKGKRLVWFSSADNHILTTGLEIYGFGFTKARRRTDFP